MKNYYLFICLSIYLGHSAFSQTAWSNHARILPDKLRKVPDAILLYHSPSPNYPVLNTDPSSATANQKYVWKHSTFLRSESEDLEVIEIGSFIWFSDAGWYTNMKFDRAEFAEKFHCKNGILKKGKTYTFEKNYRFGNDLYGGDALWYVLAQDKNGRIFKGMGLIETEDELKQ